MGGGKNSFTKSTTREVDSFDYAKGASPGGETFGQKARDELYQGSAQNAHTTFVTGFDLNQAGQKNKNVKDSPSPRWAGNPMFNPAKSDRQRRFMGAALGRAEAGQSRQTDPNMTVGQLKDFARKGKKR